MGGGLRKVVSPLLAASLLELENIMWELVQDLGKACQRKNTGNRNVDENVCVWRGRGVVGRPHPPENARGWETVRESPF